MPIWAEKYGSDRGEPLTEDEILHEFRQCDALLEGHFILSSGRHSMQYLQCARLLMQPARAARMAEALVANIPQNIRRSIDIIVSPAMGGVIIGHEVGRALGLDALFLERPDGTFELRRGFRLEPGQKVLMMEDIVTTGLSSREAIQAIRERIENNDFTSGEGSMQSTEIMSRLYSPNQGRNPRDARQRVESGGRLRQQRARDCRTPYSARDRP